MILSTIPIMKLSFKANKAKKREGGGEREREREGEIDAVSSLYGRFVINVCL